METRVKKITFLSILFLFLIIFLLHFLLDRNFYRHLLSDLIWYIGYPSFLISVILSIIGLSKINTLNLKLKKRYVILNLLSIMVLLIFALRIVYVNMLNQ